ncbi:MAG TPA: branched-chain amino acid aminotransferase [Planctomycetaceae bacterium]|jgi:branched-chain amino acid aminotransferase|nr:branched-chain amino acid aminotransferase [Planctomycetaceae bacterium]
MAEPLAYLNGCLAPFSQTRLPLSDLGIVMGASVTEMARTFGHACYRLGDHVDRLYRSLRHVGFAVELTPQAFWDQVESLVRANAPLVPPHHDLGVSMFVTAGSALIYSGAKGKATARRPTVCIHTFPLPFELWAEKYAGGQHVVTPSIRHIPPECLDPKIKARSRMHWYLADEQARLVDPKAISLLLDRNDNITETSTANFFIVTSGGRVITPPPHNTLQGISQLAVMELCARLQIPCEQRDFQTYDVVNADEAFTSSTPYCILPVTRINGKPIGTGQPGPVFARILSAWSREVGLDIVLQMTRGAAERLAELETTA